MSDRFFITGFPRSRTAWLANLLTYGNSFCYHDVMLGLDRIEQLRERLDRAPARNVGISDPANLYYWRQLREWYPDAKWVVIHRSFEEAQKASLKAFGVTIPQTSAREIYAITQEINVLLVDFNNIDFQCRTIAEYCGVDIGSDERIKQLCRMNVQVDPAQLRVALSELEKHPPQWIKEMAA